MKTKLQNGVILITLAFLAITALPGGFMLIIDPSGEVLQLSTEQLVASPFHNFFIPGLFLFTCLGVGAVFAFASLHLKKPFAAEIVFANGVATLIWIITEAMMIKQIHFLQLIYSIVGVILVSLSAKHLFKSTLPGKPVD